MQFSSDGTNFSPPETYTTTKAWTLTTGDGQKTVYVKFKDSAGNWSAAYNNTIILDTSAPTGSITINNNAQYANSPQIVLTLSAADNSTGIDKMCFSNDNVNWSSPESYNVTKNWNITIGDSEKTVYVKFSDRVGNWSRTYSDVIILDTAGPSIQIICPKDEDEVAGSE
jgi:hypothetical protein